MIQNPGFATGRFTPQELREAERRRHQLAQLAQVDRAQAPVRRRRAFSWSLRPQPRPSYAG